MLQKLCPSRAVGENRGDCSPSWTTALLTLPRLAGATQEAPSQRLSMNSGRSTLHRRGDACACLSSAPWAFRSRVLPAPFLMEGHRKGADALGVGFVCSHLWRFWDWGTAGRHWSTTMKVVVECSPSNVLTVFSISLHPQLQRGVPQRGVVRFPRLARNQGNGQKVTSQDTPPSTSGCRQVPHCSFPRGDVRGLRGTVLWPGGDGWVGWEPGSPKLAVFSLSKSLFVPHLTPTLRKRKPATE